MSDEQTEILKQLLSKMNKIEQKLEKTDKEIQELRAKGSTPSQVSRPKDNRPLPKDPLARALVKGARAKQGQEATEAKRRITIEELRQQYSPWELARFALKHDLLKRGKESMRVESSDVTEVYEE